ncbi:MAG: hypothetical protein M1835_003579, partial [Candelina submexicana]
KLYRRDGHIGRELSEGWKRIKRRLNKLLGRSATPDVGTRGSLIRALRAKTEGELEHSIESVLAATPKFPSLIEEDIDDALEFAGLKPLKGYDLAGSLTETTAAFAGSGFGLCTSYTDINLCEHQQDAFPAERVLAVHFTDATLSTVLTTLTNAHSNYQ